MTVPRHSYRASRDAVDLLLSIWVQSTYITNTTQTRSSTNQTRLRAATVRHVPHNGRKLMTWKAQFAASSGNCGSERPSCKWNRGLPESLGGLGRDMGRSGGGNEQMSCSLQQAVQDPKVRAHGNRHSSLASVLLLAGTSLKYGEARHATGKGKTIAPKATTVANLHPIRCG